MPAAAHHNDPRVNISRQKGQRLSTQTVITPIASLHRRANRRSWQETELLYGHHFDVYESKKGWVWGQAKSPIKRSKEKGYVGYVPARCLADVRTRASHVVTVLKAPVFAQMDIKSHVVQSLPLGAHVKGQGRHKDFLQIGAGGYIHRRHLKKISAPPENLDYVDIAQAHLGLPYVWGGISTEGLDCSGLVLSSLRAVGHDAPRDADMMEAGLGYDIPTSQRGLKRGDLVFWKGHVGIMQTPTRLLHANAYHMCVATEPLKEAVARIEESGGGPITAIKRF